MEGALVGGLVAQTESELLFVHNLAGARIVAGEFEVQGAATEPVMLRHGFNEHGFRDGFGVVLFAKVGEKRIKIGLRFCGKDAEGSGEAVADAVQSRGGFTGVGLGTGRELGVFAIGLDLRFGGHVGDSPLHASLQCGRAEEADRACPEY